MLPIDIPQDELISILNLHIKNNFEIENLTQAEPELCLRLDLNIDGNFGESWFIVKDKTLLCLYFTSQKEKSAENSYITYYRFDDINEITVDNFVSSNRIVVKQKDDRTVAAGFCTNSKKQRLFAFINVIEQMKNGKVVKATADKGLDYLMALLDTDEGARYLGEIAIGTNYNIQRFTRNMLFDEKIGGTVHAAVGLAIPEAGGDNVSAIHMDMICNMRGGGQIHADGKLIYENGQFVKGIF